MATEPGFPAYRIHPVPFEKFYDRLGRNNPEEFVRLEYKRFVDEWDGVVGYIISHWSMKSGEIIRFQPADRRRPTTDFYASDVILAQIEIDEVPF